MPRGYRRPVSVSAAACSHCISCAIRPRFSVTASYCCCSPTAATSSRNSCTSTRVTRDTCIYSEPHLELAAVELDTLDRVRDGVDGGPRAGRPVPEGRHGVRLIVREGKCESFLCMMLGCLYMHCTPHVLGLSVHNPEKCLMIANHLHCVLQHSPSPCLVTGCHRLELSTGLR